MTAESRDGFTCVACGTALIQPLRKGAFSYYVCGSCGTASMRPLPGDQEIVDHYRRKFESGNYELLRRFASEYQVVYRGFLESVRRAFAEDGRPLRGLSVLDVGCFTGEFLVLAADAGCDVRGFELQDEAVAIAQQRLGERVAKTDVHDRGIDGQHYDAICLFGLIEHVRDPVGLLVRCRSLLRPGGRLFLQTPNRGSLLAGLLGKYWPPYSPVEHLHLFSQSALEKVLQDNGYSVTLVYGHWKRLPVEYVFEMMRHYGPEIRALIRPLYALSPKWLRASAAPFYIGEMFVVATRTDPPAA